ncbi:MAG: glycosyltransferase family A protein [Patescibacteria group bacterium]
MKISVLIITRNRANSLARCLRSLTHQGLPPDEVIVVDNNSVDQTPRVCTSFSSSLPLVYLKEKRLGIPYARNASIRVSRGEILAFLDDDCLASRNWLVQINKHFQQLTNSVGLVGATTNANPGSLASLIEFAYHYRRLLQHVPRPQELSQILSGNFIDFKNAAFRAGFLKKFRFSYNVPFGDVGNEDVEIGDRLYRANPNIFYNPAIKVAHAYSATIARLLVRNFWSGFSDKMLLIQHHLNTKTSPFNYSKIAWAQYCWRQIRYLPNRLDRVIYLPLLLIYPLFSRSGRGWATIIRFFRLSAGIPQR